MSIADNFHRVRERIADAAAAVGRRAEEITLVGVTKYVGPDEAAELFAAGCHNLGESRPQELWKKAAELKQARPSPHERAGPSSVPENPVLRWHLVGHLQRNKIRRTLPLVSLIHSVDSERLLAAINEEQATTGDGSLPARVLLEVNTSGEPAKHGLLPEQVEPLLATAERYPNVAIRGLMTMAALEGGTAAAARNFAMLRELRDRLKSNAPPGVTLDDLSMGMSGDFEIGIHAGATMVRIGSLLWE
jgi:pyridoxal phosphate enzyme (YggS family)